MNKTYILDTNVLLSDANALFSFQENNIVLPFIVIEELDRHKDRQDDVGRNARETARRLSLITKHDKNLSSGVSLGENMGTLRVISLVEAAAGNVIEIPVELEEVKSGDNSIIKFCLNYINANKQENVILVTRDILLQLKCISVKINVEDYKKFNVASDANRLYSGCSTISNVDVGEFYKDQDGFRLPEEDSDKLQPNEFVVLRNPVGNSSSAMARFIHKDKPLKKIVKRALGKFETRNKEQEFAIDLLLDPSVKLVTLVGSAGTGKTLCALAAGLEQVIGNGSKGSPRNSSFKSLVVCRPIQPLGKDIGFLPGTLQEKMEPWIAPIKDNLRYLITEGKKGNFNDEILQEYFDQGIIEVEAMAFIRGRSIANAFIIIDEAQNLNMHELKTILTRVGENTKIVLTGDVEQIDNLYVDSTSNGLAIAVEKFKHHPISGHVTLIKGERSELATLSAKLLG